MGREVGSEVETIPCGNCGEPLAVSVEQADGSKSAGPCPKCWPANEKASAPTPAREAGTNPSVDVVDEKQES